MNVHTVHDNLDDFLRLSSYLLHGNHDVIITIVQPPLEKVVSGLELNQPLFEIINNILGCGCTVVERGFWFCSMILCAVNP